MQINFATNHFNMFLGKQTENIFLREEDLSQKNNFRQFICNNFRKTYSANTFKALKSQMFISQIITYELTSQREKFLRQGSGA